MVAFMLASCQNVEEQRSRVHTSRAVLLEEDRGLELVAGPHNLLLSGVVYQATDLPHHAPRLQQKHPTSPFLLHCMLWHTSTRAVQSCEASAITG